jgi:hypothetical protein
VKNGLIALLFIALCCAIAGHSPAKTALIEDTTLVKPAASRGAPLSEAPYLTCKTPAVPSFLIRPTAKRIA